MTNTDLSGPIGCAASQILENFCLMSSKAVKHLWVSRLYVHFYGTKLEVENNWFFFTEEHLFLVTNRN